MRRSHLPGLVSFIRLAAAGMPFTSVLLPLLLFSCYVHGEMRTIDDTYGDSVTGALPTYSDTDCWNQGPCSTCFLKPDASKAHDGTWHDTSSNTCSGMDAESAMQADHTVSFSFVGEFGYSRFIQMDC